MGYPGGVQQEGSQLSRGDVESKPCPAVRPEDSLSDTSSRLSARASGTAYSPPGACSPMGPSSFPNLQCPMGFTRRWKNERTLFLHVERTHLPWDLPSPLNQWLTEGLRRVFLLTFLCDWDLLLALLGHLNAPGHLPSPARGNDFIMKTDALCVFPCLFFRAKQISHPSYLFLGQGCPLLREDEENNPRPEPCSEIGSSPSLW